MRHRRLAPALALLLALGGGPIGPAIAQANCDPFDTVPIVDPSIPTAEQELGFALGSQEVTVDESNDYLLAVDAASERVASGVAATLPSGRVIRYAVVGTEARIDDLPAVQAAMDVLMDPLASAGAVDAAVESAPVILWVAANVHGGEESGADASLIALYNLAARSDCVVQEILDNAVVVIMPIQNPDGREEETRRNLYGFDMNRDWFARTQVETDGKLEVVRQFPPQLFIDAHEFGFANYFFPPNADPEYHEIPDAAHDWINGLYSPAIVDQFKQEKDPLLPRRSIRLLRDRLRRHGARRGLPCRRHDVREGERRRRSRFARTSTSPRSGRACSPAPRRENRSSVAGTPRGPAPTSRASTARSRRTTSSRRATRSSRRFRISPFGTTSSRPTRIARTSCSSSSAASSGWTSRSAS